MAYRGRKFYSKEHFSDVIKSSYSKRDAIISLGLPTKGKHGYIVLDHFIEFYKCDTGHFLGKSKKPAATKSLTDILVGKYPNYPTSRLRERLIKEKYFDHKCSECNLEIWRNKPIPLDLDHINGIPNDHRLSNLRLLCRNCHAQTPTFCGKNIKYTNKSKSKSRTKNFIDRKQKYVDSQQHFIPLILAANIDFASYGWVSKVAPIIGQHHQKVRPWMQKIMPNIYAMAYLRPRPGKPIDNSKQTS